MITNVDTLTIFNHRLNKEERRNAFVPTVIQGVSYVEAKGASITSDGIWGDNVQYKIRIPLIAVVQDGRTYLPELEYAKLTDDEAIQHWTISKTDMIIRGEYDGESSILFEDMLNAWAKENAHDLIRITEYADDTHGGSLYMRHYRIGGQG